MGRYLLIAFSSCAAIVSLNCAKPKPEFQKIRNGMTEAEVIAAIGKPSTTAMKGGVKYLEYESWDRNHWTGTNYNFGLFYVRLVDGRVDSFGRKGDFDSTKQPEQTVNINKKVEGEVATRDVTKGEKFDLKAELTKLEQMKKDGLLNEKEYQELRQRAIDKAKAL